jgi:hypothetical protein
VRWSSTVSLRRSRQVAVRIGSATSAVSTTEVASTVNSVCGA